MAFYLKKRRSVRHFTKDPVPKETILEILDIARYAASGGNGQPVQWIVVHDPKKVKKIAGLTIEWMKTLQNTNHPMSGYIPALIAAGKRDMMSSAAVPRTCSSPLSPRRTRLHPLMPSSRSRISILQRRRSVSAPAGQVFSQWLHSYEPLQKELGMPKGRKSAYAMMFGYPQDTRSTGSPGGNPLR